MDAWHRNHPGPVQDKTTYRRFLQSIGYLPPVRASVTITTATVHAMHYHQIDVAAVQTQLAQDLSASDYSELQDELLVIPVGQVGDCSA
ncbi:hypothetical protein [Pseudomonas sp. NA-150]|uniref:hypothetical protein n=1 Tax=Pseudomonas sp. NA-150 TaxID=3367525 RepID=UPI0037C4F049